MSDASQPREDWASYLRRMTKRPKWSVARLARESGVHRATIFGWIAGDAGVTIDSVKRIAAALGDDEENALRAAGGTGGTDGQDEEVALIMRAPVSDEMRQIMLRKLADRRERDRAERIRDFEDMIDLAARGED